MSLPVTLDLSDVTFQWWNDVQRRWDPYADTNQRQIRQHVQHANLDPGLLQSLDLRTIPDMNLSIPHFGTYTLDFSTMQQINTATQFARRIQALRGGVGGSNGSNGIPSGGTVPNTYDDDDDEEEEDDDDNEEYDEKASEEPQGDILLSIAASTLSTTDRCILCLENFNPGDDVVIPIHCNGHYFHRHCPSLNTSILDYILKTKQCPVCRKCYGTTVGNMPRGTMSVRVLEMHLPGHEKDKTIQITFNFPGGRQGNEHPNPGARYDSDCRKAYLPDSSDGRHVLSLIQKAWNRKLLFTIGSSVTRGIDGCVVYNGIHFKTVPFSTFDEPWGYPDKTYLFRIIQELNDKGIF
jgi:deltex-like protein